MLDDNTTLVEREAFEKLESQSRSLLVYHHDGVELVGLVPNVPVTIGGSHADIAVRGKGLSNRHARFEFSDGRVQVHDLESTHGTRVNDQLLTGPVRIGPDDVVRLGSVVVKVTPATESERRAHVLERHDAFVAALEDELVRARAFGRPAALLLVRALCQDNDRAHLWIPAVRGLVREVDRVGLYAPNMLEICRAEADLDEALQVARRMVASQPPSLPALRCGIAVYSQAGRTVDELFSAAQGALRAATDDEPIQVGRASRTVVVVEPREDEPIVRSPAMVELHRTVDRIAPTTLPLLLLGERGSGKDFVARRLHARSGRSGPLVTVHCDSLADDHAERVLLGDARRGRPGALERAHNGTLVLDEIGALPAPVQLALLRILDARRLWSPQHEEEVPLDIRLLATTTCDLEARARVGRFREDLLMRLDQMPLRIPPLRERLADIPALIKHFAEEAAKEAGRPVPGIVPKALARLMRHHWPGNVRELRNVVQRAVRVALADRVEVEDLPERLQRLRHPDRRVDPEEDGRETVAPSDRRDE